jgi:hypothetical protein
MTIRASVQTGRAFTMSIKLKSSSLSLLGRGYSFPPFPGH